MTNIVTNDLDLQIAALEAHIEQTNYSTDDFKRAARILLRAFAYGKHESRSTSGNFIGGAKQIDKSLYKSRHVPKWFEDYGYPKDVKSTQVLATRVHATESSLAHFSRPPTREAPLNYGWVHGILRELEEQHIVLIRSKYMRDGRERNDYTIRMHTLFWRQYQLRITPGLDRSVLSTMARTLIHWHGEPHRYVVAEMRDSIDISRSHWSRVYAKQWRQMLTDYERAHVAALTAFLMKFDDGNKSVLY